MNTRLEVGTRLFSEWTNHIQTHVSTRLPSFNMSVINPLLKFSCFSRFFSPSSFYSKSHGPQRASKASEWSHSWRIPRCTSKQSEDSHHWVEKICHNGDISKNWTKIAQKTRRKLSRETAKRPRETLKELLCKHWLCATCDHNLPYSSFVWAMG